jgi:choline kinase
MKAIIVAAGTGSRLGELTKDTPKSLLDVNGQSILERQISAFRKAGIDDIILVIGPFAEKYSFKNVKYVNGKKSFSHDILYSLIEAKSEMIDDVIISYGDIIFEDSIVQALLNSKNGISLAIDLKWEKMYQNKSKNLVDKVSNVFIENNQITKIGYKENLGEPDKKTVGEFIGLAKFSKKTIGDFLKIYLELEKSHNGKFHESLSVKEGIITDMLQEFIDRNYRLNPIFVSGKWCEIDTIDDLKNARILFQ